MMVSDSDLAMQTKRAADLAAEVERLTAQLAEYQAGNAALRAQLDAATALNTDLLNDIIRLTGRVNELEDAVAWRVKGPGRGQAETG